MNKKILSISIAAYNVENFLEQTLISLLKEEVLNDIEVIIVNDGSKDKTLEIGLEYQKKYPDTVCIINKENGGHGSTINAGIKKASGKYFCVLDGDDWYDTEEFCKLITKLKDSNVDLIVNNFNIVDNNTMESKIKQFVNVKHFVEYTFDTLPDTNVMGLSAIIIKSDILKENTINIDENSYYVDMEYITYAIPFIKTIVFTPYVVYQYRVNQINQSVSTKSLLAHSENHKNVCYALLDFLNRYKNSKEYTDSKMRYLIKVIHAMIANEYLILLLKPSSKENKVMIKNFSMYIKKNSSECYEQLKNVKWVKLLFDSNFTLYYLMSLLIKIRKG